MPNYSSGRYGLGDYGEGSSGAWREFLRIVGPIALSGTAATVYTVPAGSRVRIRDIHVANSSSSPVDLTISVGTDAAATRIYDDYPIAGKRVFSRLYPLDLQESEVIQAYAGTADVLKLTITGYVAAI